MVDVASLLNKKLPQVANRREHQASRLFRIETMDLTFSNGTQATYERICGGRGAVMAVPFDGTSFYLTVEYCGGTMNYGLGLVKGKIDAGETPEQAVGRELEEAALQGRVGQVERVLIEEVDAQGVGVGYSSGYLRVHVPGARAGEIVRAKILGVENHELKGAL